MKLKRLLIFAVMSAALSCGKENPSGDGHDWPVLPDEEPDVEVPDPGIVGSLPAVSVRNGEFVTSEGALPMWGVNLQPCLSWEYDNRLAPRGIQETSDALCSVAYNNVMEVSRLGADIIRVRKMFRDNLADYRAKAEAVDKAEIYKDSFAIGVCDPTGTESPTVVGAQAANSLLEIRSIKAAIVLTPYDGKIYVSARSIDEVNVQIMMEKLGGGGHKSVAGAQLTDVSVEEAKDRIKAIIDEMMNEGDIL